MCGGTCQDISRSQFSTASSHWLGLSLYWPCYLLEFEVDFGQHTPTHCQELCLLVRSVIINSFCLLLFHCLLPSKSLCIHTFLNSLCSSQLYSAVIHAQARKSSTISHRRRFSNNSLEEIKWLTGTVKVIDPFHAFNHIWYMKLATMSLQTSRYVLGNVVSIMPNACTFPRYFSWY